MDTLENKIVWDCEEKGLWVLIFLQTMQLLFEGNRETVKTFEFQILSIPDFSVISTYNLPTNSLGDENSKIENWAISPDNQKSPLM